MWSFLICTDIVVVCLWQDLIQEEINLMNPFLFFRLRWSIFLLHLFYIMCFIFQTEESAEIQKTGVNSTENSIYEMPRPVCLISSNRRGKTINKNVISWCVLAHLSWKLQRAFLFTCCLSISLFACQTFQISSPELLG